MADKAIAVRTLMRSHSSELVVKKSRFVTWAQRCDTVDEAMAAVAAVSKADATHNCWAYKIEAQYRFSDDGEPGGTAGRPILAAIEGQGADHVVVVVTRYFGGIKLGAGGLVRAYSTAASQCLRGAQLERLIPMWQGHIDAAFEYAAIVRNTIHGFAAAMSHETYTSSGMSLVVTIEADRREAFCDALMNATRGKVRVNPVSDG